VVNFAASDINLTMRAFRPATSTGHLPDWAMPERFNVSFWPKKTSQVALHMSAFRGKADMTLCRNPLLRSLLGVKRT
jgi:hypothetical protein